MKSLVIRSGIVDCAGWMTAAGLDAGGGTQWKHRRSLVLGNRRFRGGATELRQTEADHRRQRYCTGPPTNDNTIPGAPFPPINDSKTDPMKPELPRSTQRELHFAYGTAIGTSQRRQGGQYCAILTLRGIVGCGIYDLETAAEFGQAIAIAKGTPEKPLIEPEDLFDAKIVGVTPKAAELGIEPGMTGLQAVERMLGHDVAQ